jgi:hypothetical protein
MPHVALFADPAYRYRMPRVVAKVEGRGNGIRTVVVNMEDVAEALGRDPAVVTKVRCVRGLALAVGGPHALCSKRHVLYCLRLWLTEGTTVPRSPQTVSGHRAGQSVRVRPRGTCGQWAPWFKFPFRRSVLHGTCTLRCTRTCLHLPWLAARSHPAAISAYASLLINNAPRSPLCRLTRPADVQGCGERRTHGRRVPDPHRNLCHQVRPVPQVRPARDEACEWQRTG